MDVTDTDDWVIGHNTCIIVTTGTVVTWTGNFTNHPMAGGEDGTEDAASPITTAADAVNGGNGNQTLEVTFAAAGDFPYYCEIHVGAMNGVVYVVD